MLIDAHTRLDHDDAAVLAVALDEIAAEHVLTIVMATSPASYARVRAIAACLPRLIVPGALD